MVLSDNGKTSRYTYNAAGERIIKNTVIWKGYISMARHKESTNLYEQWNKKHPGQIKSTVE